MEKTDFVAIAISRLKNKTQRVEVIAQGCPLGQIRSQGQAVTAPKSSAAQVRFVGRYAQVGKQLQQAKVTILDPVKKLAKGSVESPSEAML